MKYIRMRGSRRGAAAEEGVLIFMTFENYEDKFNLI